MNDFHVCFSELEVLAMLQNANAAALSSLKYDSFSSKNCVEVEKSIELTAVAINRLMENYNNKLDT